MSDLHRALVLCLGLCSFLMIYPTESHSQSSKSVTKGKPNAKNKGSGNELNVGIREYSSNNFALRTDLSTDDANELLDRLEKMLARVSKYYGKPNAQVIEMNVVHDKKRWPTGSIPDEAINSILDDGGITLSLTVTQHNALGEKQIAAAKSTVWAVSARGVPQHEAIHAYCHQNFGRTGPTWYAEGMAELGHYWREKDDSIQIHDDVMQYLKNSQPKDLLEITAPGQVTGDSWRNYAWRWALCQLLSTNPNYAPRFKPLGMALLNDRRSSFEDVYGPMAKEISFEYRFFLEHMNQGFRSDLCAWDWKTKFQRLKGTAAPQVKVVANRGWQASRVMVKQGEKISYSATGEWELCKGEAKVGPDGDKNGRGRLEGVLFTDYRLSEPFDLGAGGEYEAQMDGNLFVRCRDDWCEIADNQGAVTVKFKTVP